MTLNEICEELLITPAQLRVLFRLKRGDRVSGGMAGQCLERDGLVTSQGYVTDPDGGLDQIPTWKERAITPLGLSVCARARQLGY